MNKALDEQCAALLGWRRAKPGAISGVVGAEYSCYWYDADGKAQRACITDAFANMYPFSPTSNDADAKLLEDAMERDTCGELYAEYLHQQTYQHNDTLPASRWRVIRATPEQRTRAFIAVHTGELPQ